MTKWDDCQGTVYRSALSTLNTSLFCYKQDHRCVENHESKTFNYATCSDITRSCCKNVKQHSLPVLVIALLTWLDENPISSSCEASWVKLLGNVGGEGDFVCINGGTGLCRIVVGDWAAKAAKKARVQMKKTALIWNLHARYSAREDASNENRHFAVFYKSKSQVMKRYVQLALPLRLDDSLKAVIEVWRNDVSCRWLRSTADVSSCWVLPVGRMSDPISRERTLFRRNFTFENF